MSLIPAPGMEKQKDNSVSTYGDPISKGKKKKLMMGEGNNQLRFNNVSGNFLQ